MKIGRITLSIHGLACGGGGVLTFARALGRVPGVRRANINPATELAYVECDGGQATQCHLRAEIEKAGFRTGARSAHLVRDAEGAKR